MMETKKQKKRGIKKTSNSNGVKERKKTSSVCRNCSTVQTFCQQCQKEYKENKKNIGMKPWQTVGFFLGFVVGFGLCFLVFAIMGGCSA